MSTKEVINVFFTLKKTLVMKRIEMRDLFCGVVGAVCVVSLAHIIGVFGFILGVFVMVGAYHITH